MKAVLLLAALSLAACGSTGTSTVPGSDSSSSSGFGRSTENLLGGAPAAVALYDAPIAGMNGVKVNIGIDGWQFITSLGTAVPFVSNAKPDVEDVLTLANGPKNIEGKAPIGTYSAVRMLIDAASSNVKIGNMTIPIYWGTPGHVTTSSVVAIDFPANFAVTGIGQKPTISLDFNVYESVKFYNNAIYVQPSVSAAYAAASINGKIKNAAGKPVSTATLVAMDQLGHVVNTTFTGSDGNYKMHALPPGIYTIQVRNSYTTAAGDVTTASGADAGASPSTTIVLSPNDNVHLDDITD